MTTQHLTPAQLEEAMAEYRDIRPYLDHEVVEELQALVNDPEFAPILADLFKEGLTEKRQQILSQIGTIADFKAMVVYHVVNKLAGKTTFSVTSSGKSEVDTSCRHLFITNHRDIILDPAFLNVICLEAFKSLPRIAIGDNLLIRPWIRRLVRLCDAFIVKRAPSIREMLQESRTLSRYIRHTITADEESVWIAQREGRAKDANDRTQPALLKMLAMSGEGTPAEALQELNITPVALSYEYDPCDYLKAKELLQKKLNPEHKKSPADDYINMQTGLTGYKGRVHFAFAPMLSDLATLTQECQGKQEPYNKIAAEIDRSIFLHYRIYPGNYIAYDILQRDGGGAPRFSKMYSAAEYTQFVDYLQSRIALIEMEGKDEAFLRHTLLTMYANPLINQLQAQQ